MNNVFEGAKYSDRFICRNGTIAYYGRYDEKDGTHFLLVNDPENDYIVAYDDGHVFHVDEEDTLLERGPYKGKTVYELYGWDKEEMRNYKLDIVSRYKEVIDEENLDELADSFNYHSWDNRYDESEKAMRYGFQQGFKIGYRKAKEE